MYHKSEQHLNLALQQQNNQNNQNNHHITRLTLTQPFMIYASVLFMNPPIKTCQNTKINQGSISGEHLQTTTKRYHHHHHHHHHHPPCVAIAKTIVMLGHP